MFYFQNIFLAIFLPLWAASLISTNFAIIFKCKDFTEQRIQKLENIAERGDSRIRFVPTFAEYEAMIGCHRFKKGTSNVFVGVVRKLVERINEFAVDYEEIKQIGMGQIDEGMLRENGKLAIGCKKLMMEILSEKGEGIRLNIFTFIETKKTREFEWLGKCVQIAKLQSAELDEMINEDLWDQHLANAPRNDNGQEKQRRVVVEGGGPVGLLATFRLFMAGMEVTMVNGREEYTRSQVTLFDANWQAQLRYLLGTKFDQLFGPKNTFGRIFLTRALFSVKYLERIMKDRLLEFGEFLKKKIAKNDEMSNRGKLPKNLPIELIYGLNIEELEGPKSAEDDPNFYAILGKSPNDKRGQRISLDFFVCAGGANDQMRDKLFGEKPQNRSPPVNYGVSRLYKPKEAANSGKIIILEAPLHQILDMKEMGNFIKKANFEKVTENIGAEFSPEIRNLLNGLAKKLVKSGKEHFVSMETWELFSMSYITPKPILDILKQIEKEKKIKNVEKFGNGWKMLDKLKQRILAKWTAAVFGYFYANAEPKLKPEFRLNIDANGEPRDGHDPKGLNFDKTNGNFDVQIRTADKVVAEKIGANGQQRIMVTVLGDALANPHFYTGSGLSSGRMGVEFLVENIKKLNSGKIEGKKKFVEILNGKLDLVKENVVEWASEFIEILPKKEEGENESK